jgi:hypothetical protein
MFPQFFLVAIPPLGGFGCVKCFASSAEQGLISQKHHCQNAGVMTVTFITLLMMLLVRLISQHAY